MPKRETERGSEFETSGEWRRQARSAICFCAWLLLAITSPARPADAPSVGWHESSLHAGGLERWYRVYRPASFTPGAPAVLLLHGGTQSMRKIFNKRAGGTREWTAIADREGALLLVPNGVNPDTGDTHGDNQHWNDVRARVAVRSTDADDVGFIRALLDEAAVAFAFDPRRLYVTGASNGGMMTYRLLIELPQRFAAGAAFVANLPAEDDRLRKPVLPTPLMIMNGTEDPLVRWDGGTIGRGRGTARSTLATVQWWIDALDAERAPASVERLPDRDPQDGCEISVAAHAARAGGATVAFYTMHGGGHAMPSFRHPIPDTRLVRLLLGPVCRDAEGAEIAWRFFIRHRR